MQFLGGGFARLSWVDLASVLLYPALVACVMRATLTLLALGEGPSGAAPARGTRPPALALRVHGLSSAAI